MRSAAGIASMSAVVDGSNERKSNNMLPSLASLYASDAISPASKVKRTQQGTQAPVTFSSGMFTGESSISRALPVSSPNQHRKLRGRSAKLQFSVFRSKIEL